ncbi:Transcription factor [Aspergillus sclerotialis]|uniref:Transcription factor n=1 Tax=Aspergillus sclerotialis TaxID=2070753 RepID=A0A3A2ZDL9_9EURO|nr:Transcription factor [Aspergillus sclerotialis]
MTHHLRTFKISWLKTKFTERVAPFVPILHKDIVNQLLKAAEPQNPGMLDNESEALCFAIYLIALTSTNGNECMEIFANRQRDDLMQRYRAATEDAIMRAVAGKKVCWVVIQAAIFLAYAGWSQFGSRYVGDLLEWILGLAKLIGLENKSELGMTIFQGEMYRRLWMELSLMDTRVSEDLGRAFQIRSVTVEIPLNVNDDQLRHGMEKLPDEQRGFTNMAFGTIRFAIASTMRYLRTGDNGQFELATTPEYYLDYAIRLDYISRFIEEKYILHCDLTVPIQWFTCAVARVILGRLWIMVNSLLVQEGFFPPAEALKMHKRLFRKAVEINRVGLQIGRVSGTVPFTWKNLTHLPLRNLLFLAKYVTTQKVKEKVWRDVKEGYYRTFDVDPYRNEPLWDEIDHLMILAAAARDETLARQR